MDFVKNKYTFQISNVEVVREAQSCRKCPKNEEKIDLEVAQTIVNAFHKI